MGTKSPYFPSIVSKWIKHQLLKEVTAPSTPAADYIAVYVDSADGKLKIKNDAGTVKIISDLLVSPIAESDVTNLVSDLAAKEATANKNIASGYAGLSASSILTPSQIAGSLSGNTLKVVRVNAGETALELATVGGGGFWELLGSQTLLANAASMSVSFASKKHIMVIISVLPVNNVGIDMELNDNATADYYYRTSINNGAETLTSADTKFVIKAGSGQRRLFGVFYLIKVPNNNVTHLVGQVVEGSSDLQSISLQGYKGTLTELLKVEIVGSGGNLETDSQILVFGKDL